MTIQTRTVIRPTRHVRDIYLGRKYRIVARFPGGREIDKGYAKTRQRAFQRALEVNRPQTSPTAGGTSYQPGPPIPPWKNPRGDDILFQ